MFLFEFCCCLLFLCLPDSGWSARVAWYFDECGHIPAAVLYVLLVP
jgi:hypothetical protein